MKRTSCCIYLYIGVWIISVLSLDLTDNKSPYNQNLPDCTSFKYNKVVKKTKVKGIVCPMIKNEIGFLSEWTAYYEMQGFNHIIFYDNNSTTSLSELEPWIELGFVTIIRDWWLHDKRSMFTQKKHKYFDMMRIKMMAEVDCKRRAISMGYEIFASVDLDEYIIPSSNDSTVIDEMVNWFHDTTRGVMILSKYQFPPTPHYLEPINLLTIEAYQTKMKEANKMNYYSHVAEKVALRLQGSPEYTNGTIEFLTNCCDFHGCNNMKFYSGCHKLYKAGERWKFDGKHRKWISTPLHINHYARSLEKFMMKQESWETAAPGGEYDFYTFMDRVFGFTFDNQAAITWGCQLRDLLRERTGFVDYIRPGDWYRNPEFGEAVENPNKRGRYGRGYGKYLQWHEMNPYPKGVTYQRSHKPYWRNYTET